MSSLSQHRALQPPDKHHQHQLEKVFAFTLPTPGPSTRGKVPVQPNHWTYLAKDPASIISISWKTFLSSLSQHRALQYSDKHHQHQLGSLFEFALPTPGPSTRGKVPVQPNHWTDLAKDPASIISISWKTFWFLSSLSQHRALQPPGEHHQHQLEKFLPSLSQLQAHQPAARFQFNPIIGRI